MTVAVHRRPGCENAGLVLGSLHSKALQRVIGGARGDWMCRLSVLALLHTVQHVRAPGDLQDGLKP